MAKKLKPREISALQDEYLAKRQALLESKVDKLSVNLFDKVFNTYLIQLEQVNGKLVQSDRNFNIVRGLDDIYRLFVIQDNIPVIKDFIKGVQGIVPLNERYFKSLMKQDVSKSTEKITGIVDKRLGIDTNGQIKPGGFVDKFIKDQTLLKKIKKTTIQSITQGKGFQEFRQDLKKVIQGNPEVKASGGLQQYYRNYAYDTYVKTDRLTSELYAKDMGLRYFYWTGGKVAKTRNICEYCNGKIMDSQEWNKVKSFLQLKKVYREGMDKNSNPSTDLGGYGCIHRKRFVLDSVALQMPEKIINVQVLLS